MQIPEDVPGLKWLAGLWGVSVVVWSIVEGDPERVFPFGFLTALMVLAVLFQRIMAGRSLSAVNGVVLMGGWGLALGGGTVLMTLFLMIIKTGLHGHGPEFALDEVLTVWSRLPLGSLAGFLAGLGAGLLLLARRPKRQV